MYDQDTFFQLTRSGQAGLAGLSILLGVAVIFLSHFLFRQVPRLSLGISMCLRIIIAVAVFWVFLWLSPQVYYLYYQMIFDGLPWQSVVMSPPAIAEVGQMLFFQGANSLAQHSKAVLGWLLILLAIKNTLWPNP